MRGEVADAAAAAGRSADELTTIVVTKFHPVSLIAELAALGVRDVGENRHQEAQAKAAELAPTLPELRWHFVGQLQSKKARQVRAYASAIHSIDRASVVDALRSDEASVDVFVQVNLTDDPGRGGVAPDALDALVERVLGTPGLRLRGLMAVAPLGVPARPEFARVRELSARIQRQAPEADALSMGMSHDFRDAILEGATHLRIGTAITGNRPA
ncbi:YggS family pyridoxal phosphate-dependent enzyme [Agromyces aerolatus]|uniref:YggS family pyridoxal phosphate-dependent enzyme n=1 Tax=Agromyces sp. LY-1074 TaxID=3074080 RepID=UPI00285DD8BE|nr:MULTISPECIES: YggS family pyridoxal phosphate-dependent enzyme [unclassified Agromyces]MDR5700764.1 YggS family pyridoxal phosphate-dependent enzyme [Agromyces sp. LY-1074]MDR5707285.1 YggS family pyridoxal phosphate-dependent enzyme [Agromyces sp. LY-1358]